MPQKHMLGINVLGASRQRIAWIFDNFAAIYLSFSGGKDSTVMLHLAMDEAERRGRRIGLLFIDLEAQYKITIEHVERCFARYADLIEPFWVSLPIHLRNAVSMFEPHWVCWERGRESDWVRQPPTHAITDTQRFPFFRPAMEFEEFVEYFGDWYGRGQSTACLVGIRTQESLNRFRTLASESKQPFQGRKWTTWKGGAVVNAYPIYDWQTEDIWTYHARYPDRPHNGLYDLMHKAGLTIHQQRICQPYGDDQRKGLWLYHIIEPETWCRVVARVNGANSGALYAQEAGNVLGRLKITKPDGHTWQSFARLLLESLPPRTQEHFGNKIAVFVRWYQDRGYPNGIPDEADAEAEASRKVPSWRRVCKALLKNDYWCKSLSFSQHKSQAYDRWRKIMEKRRRTWKIPV